MVTYRPAAARRTRPERTRSYPAAQLRIFLPQDLFEQGRQPASLGFRELASHRGQGSSDLACSPQLAAAVAKGTFDVRARAVPLAQVEQAWADAAHTTDRIVLVP
jgi:hypothetical protein